MMQLISSLVTGLALKRGNIPSLKLQKHQSDDNTAEHAIRSSRKSRATIQTLKSAQPDSECVIAEQQTCSESSLDLQELPISSR